MTGMAIHLRLWDQGAEDYDRLVAEGAPQASEVTLAIKPGLTVEGRSAVVIAFDAEVGGQRVPVQAVVTLRMLLAAARALRAQAEAQGEGDLP